MASKKTKASELANVAKANPYIQRLMDDAELRDNIQTALDSSKSAYARLSNGKTPYKAVLQDKKLQRDLRKAYEASREALESLQEGPKRKRKGLSFGRILIVAVLGATAALVASEKLRSKVLDTLFGAEEEFQYTPPSSTGAAPAPEAPVSAA